MQNKKKESEKNLGFMGSSLNQQLNETSSNSATSYIAEKMLDDMIVDRIAKKIARGEIITGEEKEKIRAINPEKLRKAEEVNKQRQEIGQRLRNAKTREEAQTIISNEKSSAIAIIDKGDAEYGELLLEAVNKEATDYYKKNRIQSTKLPSESVKGRPHLFDIKL